MIYGIVEHHCYLPQHDMYRIKFINYHIVIGYIIGITELLSLSMRRRSMSRSSLLSWMYINAIA